MQAIAPNPSVKGASASGLRPLADAPYVERYALMEDIHAIPPRRA